MRSGNRNETELRPVSFTRHYTSHAEGSVLVTFGETRVLCNASIENSVPPFLKGKNRGWITAEYGMLPRSTHNRMRREAVQGKQSGRTAEIQRLIGRALRATVDLELLGENTIIVDCDVLQADGGTRTAAITGGYVALVDAVRKAMADGTLARDPLVAAVASVSVGIHAERVLLDLDYTEDAAAETDMNIVMNDKGEYIEIQGTPEKNPFSADALRNMLTLAEQGIGHLIAMQQQALQV